jgi:hypothetical protein
MAGEGREGTDELQLGAREVEFGVGVMLNHAVETRVSLNHLESRWPHGFGLPKRCM